MTIEQQRSEWLDRLRALIERVDSWAAELGWSTRLIEKSMRDSLIGDYIAPALLMQREAQRVLLEPITHSAIGADGVVDLYLMPAYDDVATLIFERGSWTIRGAEAHSAKARTQPLTKEAFAAVLQDMTEHAAAT